MPTRRTLLLGGLGALLGSSIPLSVPSALDFLPPRRKIPPVYFKTYSLEGKISVMGSTTFRSHCIEAGKMIVRQMQGGSMNFSSGEPYPVESLASERPPCGVILQGSAAFSELREMIAPFDTALDYADGVFFVPQASNASWRTLDFLYGRSGDGLVVNALYEGRSPSDLLATLVHEATHLETRAVYGKGPEAEEELRSYVRQSAAYEFLEKRFGPADRKKSVRSRISVAEYLLRLGGRFQEFSPLSYISPTNFLSLDFSRAEAEHCATLFSGDPHDHMLRASANVYRSLYDPRDQCIETLTYFSEVSPLHEKCVRRILNVLFPQVLAPETERIPDRGKIVFDGPTPAP